MRAPGLLMESRRSSERSRRALRYVEVVALVLVAVVGVAIGRASAASQEVAQPTRPSVAEPTRASAVSAATSYLSALRWDVLVDAGRRRRTIGRLATPEAAPALDAELAAPAEALRAAVTRGPVVARSSVLGYRIDDFAADRAVVSIWGMALFATGVYQPTTQWSTSRIELVWSADRWLVAGVRSRGGPSPDSRLALLVRVQRTFRELRHAP